jgi:hypothetical protein
LAESLSGAVIQEFALVVELVDTLS